MDEKCFDIVVCGGGCAGLIAAIAAVRQGASVAVVEDDEEIGGAPVDNLIQSFSGFPQHGYYKELREKIYSFNPENNSGQFETAAYLFAISEMSKNLNISYFKGHRIAQVSSTNGHIDYVSSDRAKFRGKVFIDSTGNGDVAFLMGCEYRYGRESRDTFDEKFAPEKADNKVQMCTLMYRVRKHIPSDDKPSGKILNKDEYLIWGPTGECGDTTDADIIRKTREKMFEELPDTCKRWQKRGYYITAVAPKLGVRESRRILGEYMLSLKDVTERRTHHDGITVASHPIDAWDAEGNPFANDKESLTPFYEIPYRCLIPKNTDNLLVAGRCISTTHIVNSRNRVMSICMMTGQAAGNAAYRAIQEGVPCKDIDIGRLRTTLKEQGMYTSLEETKELKNY